MSIFIIIGIYVLGCILAVGALTAANYISEQENMIENTLYDAECMYKKVLDQFTDKRFWYVHTTIILLSFLGVILTWTAMITELRTFSFFKWSFKGLQK